MATINLNGYPQAIHFVESVLNAHLQIPFKAISVDLKTFFGLKER